MARKAHPSKVRDLFYTLSSIAVILGLFVLSNVLMAIKSYESGYTEGKQYVISSIELQKCGILKKEFKKGRNGKHTTIHRRINK